MSKFEKIEPSKESLARSQVRATRSAGRQMRSRLLSVASGLFRRHGASDVSITAIAEAADAFPSQITYYFKTKEALFVEAACREVLHLAKDAETAASKARTPHSYMCALVDHVLVADRFSLFIEALILARQRPELQPQVKKTVERLHNDGQHAFDAEMKKRDWRPVYSPEETAKRFWAISLGIALEGHGLGKSSKEMSSSMKGILGEMAKEKTR